MIEKLFRFLNIREGEGIYVGYLLLHYFFQGIGLSVLFVVANTLFLSHFAIETLPLVFIASAVVLALLGKVIEYQSQKWPLPRMLKATTLFIAISVLLFFVGAFSLNLIWLPFLIYIWYQVINLQIETELWSVSSYLFDVRQAKRLYGLISVGDVPAKILGALLVAALAPKMGGTANLLILSGGSFLAGALILNRLLSRLKPKGSSEPEYTFGEPRKRTGNIFARFFQTDLVLALSFLYFVGAIVLTCIDFSFLSGVEDKFHTQEEMSGFFAVVFAVGNGLIIIGKLFVSGKAIARLGAKRSLLSLPAFLLLLCVTMVLIENIYHDEYILLWFFTMMIVFSKVFEDVLYYPLFLALFQPLPAETRGRAIRLINGVIDPFSLGISGLSLYIVILFYHHVNLHKVNYVLTGLLTIWIILVVYAVRKYKGALGIALNKRMIYGGELNLADESSLKILKAKLKSVRPDEVIYVCEILSKSHLPIFESSVPELLAHPVHEVRLYTLNTLRALNIRANSDLLYSIITEDYSPAVCEAAVQLYCALYEDIVERMPPVLSHKDAMVRAAAVKGFLKSKQDKPRALGHDNLINMFGSSNSEEQINALNIAGAVDFDRYHSQIFSLLNHEDINVKKAAITTVGQSKNPSVIRYLVPFLENKSLRKTTIDALCYIGEPVLDYIFQPDFIFDHENDVIKLCSRIGGARAADFLFSRYFIKAKAETLDEVLKALNRVNPESETYRLLIQQKIEEELAHAFLCLKILSVTEPETGHELLATAVNHELSNSRSRMFNLLSFLYDKGIIEKARDAYASDDPELKANTLEYLENIIDRKLKLKFFPFLEDLPSDQKLQMLSKIYTDELIISEQNLHHAILSGENNPFLQWTRAIALHSCDPGSNSVILNQYAASGVKLLSESASWSIQKKGSNPIHKTREVFQGIDSDQTPDNTTAPLLEIEKIMILKSAEIFTATPENIMVGIAGISREVRIRKGNEIFIKGELGNCLYIICEGEVLIHTEDKELSVLHRRDIFGELALIDPEPRSASARALTNCLLLRIDQHSFHELMEERPEIALGVLTVLSRRIRKHNELISNLQAG